MKSMESITTFSPGESHGTNSRTGIGSMEETSAGKIIIKRGFQITTFKSNHSESDAWILCPLIVQMNTDILPRSCTEVIMSQSLLVFARQHANFEDDKLHICALIFDMLCIVIVVTHTKFPRPQ